ncbi:MAG: ArsR family transcriptional regulator [Candidatus Thermoplasmatota archaeon]
MVKGIKSRIQKEDTKGEILENLLSKDLTALDLSEILEINESAVRRHLNKLESDGLINSYFEKADKGRPKKYFTLTDEGKELFPREIELLLELIIKNIQESLDEDTSHRLKENLVENLIDLFPEFDEEDSSEEKIEKVVEGFDELGFYSSYDKEDGSYRISYKNCAFGNLPKDEAYWLCDAHRRVIKKLLDDMNIQQERSMLEGNDSCVQKIGDKK